AMILSAAMMLDWLAVERDEPALAAAGDAIEAAVGQVVAEGKVLTGDLGGTASTDGCAGAVIAALKAA
ncbi:MAG: isocitrate/isopropylmalate family dehydrogenase, partial [Pseudomonadota bacterium]